MTTKKTSSIKAGVTELSKEELETTRGGIMKTKHDSARSSLYAGSLGGEEQLNLANIDLQNK